ncbi:hypothetical protein [Schlesneria sp. T3-172]|uniref:hypothetical protein n=1 Tax=Schlesneria sphaerica TaxID=3373610 RepID=UPI0037C5ECD5
MNARQRAAKRRRAEAARAESVGESPPEANQVESSGAKRHSDLESSRVERSEAAPDAVRGQKPEGPSDGLTSDFLQDPKTLSADLELAERMVKGRWRQSDYKRRQILNRLHKILEREKVDVITPDGYKSDRVKADTLAIQAARVLLAIERQDQVDEHHYDKLNRAPTHVPGGMSLTIQERTDAAIQQETTQITINRIVAMRLPDNGRGPMPTNVIESTAVQK